MSNTSKINMPRQIRINIPGDLLLESRNSVAVRIDSADRDIDRIKAYYAGRLFNFEINGDLLVNKSLLKRLGKSRIKFGPSARAFEIGKNLQLYKSLLPVFYIRTDEELIKSINYLTAFGFQVHIDTAIAPEDANIIEKAVGFYLHNPLLRTPIEPFHSLVKTLSGRASLTLWDTEYEKLGSHAYVGDSGDITLSRRWLNNGEIYGKIEDSWEELAASPLYIKLSQYKEELFRYKRPCIFCNHMDICAGFLKAADTDWPCESWIRAFDILKNEVARAKTIMSDLDKGAR